MSKREFTAGDFPLFSMRQDDSAAYAVNEANSLLPEILAPYVEDLKATRDVLREIEMIFHGTGAAARAGRALAAQRAQL